MKSLVRPAEKFSKCLCTRPVEKARSNKTEWIRGRRRDGSMQRKKKKKETKKNR